MGGPTTRRQWSQWVAKPKDAENEEVGSGASPTPVQSQSRLPQHAQLASLKKKQQMNGLKGFSELCEKERLLKTL